MTITATELARIRYWVPATWSPTATFNDAAVTAVWNREADTDATSSTEEAERQSWANVYRVAYALTEAMRSGLIGDPDSFSIGGEYSESRGAAINLLLNRLNDLRRLLEAAVAAVSGTDRVVASPYVRVVFSGR